MTGFTETFNHLMAVGAILGMIAAVFLIYTLALPKDALSKKTHAFLHKYVLFIGLGVSLFAVVASLIYSDAIGYPPCLFCWYARIAIYPQVLLYGMAIYKKDKSVVSYTLGLSIIGVIIGAYHYLSETLQYSPLPCSANGVSCLTRYVYEFGFVSIPLMGLVGSTLLLLVAIAAKKASKASTFY